MANSKIKAVKPLNIIQGEYTIMNGYFDVASSCIRIGLPIFVQIIRGDDGIWDKYTAVPKISFNGYASIYVRDANGNHPENGSKINVNVLIGGG